MKKRVAVPFCILLYLLCVSVVQSSAQQAGKQVPISSPSTISYQNALLYLPWDYDISNKKYPLILFGHGSGESSLGNLDTQGLPGNIANGNPPYAIVNGDTVRFIVLSITGQVTLSERDMSVGAKDLIRRGIRIDTNRIYITGLSAGARATVNYIPFQEKERLQLVAAVVPMSYPASMWQLENNIPDFNVFSGKGVWAFSGSLDRRTPVSEALMDSIHSHLPKTGRLTIYPNGHCCWMNYYDPSYREEIQGKKRNIYEWMLQYSLNGTEKEPQPNQPPVALAGEDRVIQLPRQSVTLDGGASHDPDGHIVSYKWIQKSGPDDAGIKNKTKVKTEVDFFKAGTYTFRLEVTDDKGSTAHAEIKITVKASTKNKSPKANAGGYQAISLPQNSLQLNGSYSHDPDGTIVSYKWTQKSGPSDARFSNPASASPTVSSLIAGVYFFDLVVTDDNGSTDKGTTRVIVDKAANKPPKANAGEYQTISLPQNSVQLNGSHDPDGTIVSYKWTQESGPSDARFSDPTSATPEVSSLIAGVYFFDLVVTDDNGSTDKETTRVIVKKPANNKPPKANAGGYQAISLPQNSVQLNGSYSYDPDGSIASYTWEQVSGPSKAKFSNTSSAAPTVSNLIAGIYFFDLSVTDNDGSTAIGRTRVTVKGRPLSSTGTDNKPPKANAGGYQAITLPRTSVQLHGARSYDPDGVIASLKWIQRSGPSQAKFSSAATAVPTVSQLVPGVYIFDLHVTDNEGATAIGTTLVTVFQTGAAEKYGRIGGQFPPIATPADNHLDEDSLFIQNAIKEKELFTKLKSNASKAKLSLFPNPAHETLHVAFHKGKTGKAKITLRIVNTRGQVIKVFHYSELPGKYTKTLHIGALEPGMYLLQYLENNRFQGAEKWIKY